MLKATGEIVIVHEDLKAKFEKGKAEGEPVGPPEGGELDSDVFLDVRIANQEAKQEKEPVWVFVDQQR